MTSPSLQALFDRLRSSSNLTFNSANRSTVRNGNSLEVALIPAAAVNHFTSILRRARCRYHTVPPLYTTALVLSLTPSHSLALARFILEWKLPLTSADHGRCWRKLPLPRARLPQPQWTAAADHNINIQFFCFVFEGGRSEGRGGWWNVIYKDLQSHFIRRGACGW